MVKFVFALFMLAFTTFCGYLLAKKYRQKKDFFQQFDEFNQRYINELSYYRRSIGEVISHYEYKGEFNIWLTIYCSKLSLEEAQFMNFADLDDFSFFNQEINLYIFTKFPFKQCK